MTNSYIAIVKLQDFQDQLQNFMIIKLNFYLQMTKVTEKQRNHSKPEPWTLNQKCANSSKKLTLLIATAQLRPASSISWSDEKPYSSKRSLSSSRDSSALQMNKKFASNFWNVRRTFGEWGRHKTDSVCDGLSINWYFL